MERYHVPAVLTPKLDARDNELAATSESDSYSEAEADTASVIIAKLGRECLPDLYVCERRE